MALSQLDSWGQRFYDQLIKEWNATTYREIFGVGMVIIGIVAAYRPAGSIALASSYGLNPLLHAVWYAISGWLLAKYGHRGRWWRWFYSLPILVYIGLTTNFMIRNWNNIERPPNIVVLIYYILLYIAVLKLIADDHA